MCSRASAGATWCHIAWVCGKPCSKSTGGPEPPCTALIVAPPLSLPVSYRVVANSFLVGGGDTFTAFKNGTAPTTGPVDVDVLVEYFQKHSPVSPPPANHGKQIG